jgi:hypothetical protein
MNPAEREIRKVHEWGQSLNFESISETKEDGCPPSCKIQGHPRH